MGCRLFLCACLSAFRRGLLGGHCCNNQGQKEKGGPKRGRNCYVTPKFTGVPIAKRRERKQKRIVSEGQNQKWPTCGQGGYLTPAAWVVPSASEQGAESEVAHLRARWLLNPCRLGGPLRFRAGGRIRSGPQVGKVAIEPLPPGGVPTASERGAESEVAHLRARWLLNPCRLRGGLRFRPGGRIRSGPQVGKVAIEPLPPGWSPPLHGGGQNERWPTSGQGGYITPAGSGIPSASERGAESEVANEWARW